MLHIMINSKCKQYIKADKVTKNSIENCLEKLGQKILSVGKDIKQIYNNDAIIYDKINPELYIYKGHGAGNTQLRLIYGAKKQGSELSIYFIDFINKKSNNKAYITECGNRFKNMRISDFSYNELEMVR